MSPHPSQLTVVAQLATPQVPPLLPPVITTPDPVSVDTAQIFVNIQEADMQQMRVDMQTQHLVLQDHAQHQQQMSSVLLTLTSNLNGFGFSK
jgi:hypothetical protein